MIAFDLDDTLIRYGGHYTSEFVMRERYPGTWDKLNSLDEDIIIVTNQQKGDFVKLRGQLLEKIPRMKHLFVAHKMSKCRKPMPGWKQIFEEKGYQPRLYVGDSITDAKWAKNLGMEFQHPAEFFEGTEFQFDLDDSPPTEPRDVKKWNLHCKYLTLRPELEEMEKLTIAKGSGERPKGSGTVRLPKPIDVKYVM